jgi:polysaccharide biosynthesis protein PslG
MRTSRTAIVAVLVVIVAAALAGCRRATPTPGLVSGDVVAGRAGIAMGGDLLWESDAQRNADLDAVTRAGARWIAVDVDWKSIQGDGPFSLRWDRGLDAAVLAARAHGLQIFASIVYTPPWARAADCPDFESERGHCLPADPNWYAQFAGAAAQRYGANSDNPLLRGSIEHWQIWNEPNHQEFSQPRPDPVKYAAMLRLTDWHIKAADPGATVITGGTAPAPDAPDGTDYTPATWLNLLYLFGAGDDFDAVGHHPYMFPENPLDPQPWNAFTQTQTLHDILVAHGDGAKKIWGTEMGAPTGTDRFDPLPLTDDQQAQWVHDYFLGWNTTFRDFTGPLIWYTLRDRSADPSRKWDNFGLIRYDGTLKPAYLAYRQLMDLGVG